MYRVLVSLKEAAPVCAEESTTATAGSSFFRIAPSDRIASGRSLLSKTIALVPELSLFYLY